jgi:AraC family transcriptional regulator
MKTLPKTDAKQPVRVAAVTVDPPGAAFGPRTEQCYEFIWIMDGDAVVDFGGQKFRAEAGSVLLRRPGVTDHYQWSQRQRTVHAYIHFELDPALAAEFDWAEVPAKRVMPPNDIVRPLIGYVVSLDSQPEPTRSLLQKAALELLVRAYVSAQTAVMAQPPRQLPEAVDKALEIIRRHTEDEAAPALRLGDLAGAVHTSPENLCRLFKRSLELSPLEYAKLARLNKAAWLMRNTPRGLKAIAMATGFYDAYHLSRSFKQVYGLPPKVFRASEISAWLTQRNPITRSLLHRDPPKAEAPAPAYAGIGADLPA